MRKFSWATSSPAAADAAAAPAPAVSAYGSKGFFFSFLS